MVETLRKPQYLVLLAIAAVLAGLCTWAGVWQIHRYEWKKDTNTVLRDNNAAHPVPVGALVSTTTPLGKNRQFRQITARGRYEAGRQLLVRNRQVNDSPAYLVLTPLRTTDGTNLLVVRGYVDMSGAADTSPSAAPPPSGTVSIRARVYPDEPPKSDAGVPAGQINRINAHVIGAGLSGPTYLAYAELIHSTGHTTLPLLPPPDMSNPAGGAFQLQHLAYVGQWFCFALIALAAPFVLARVEQRRTDDEPKKKRSSLAEELADRRVDA